MSYFRYFFIFVLDMNIKKNKSRLFLFLFAFILLLISAYLVYQKYDEYYGKEIRFEESSVYFYIHTNDSYQDLLSNLSAENIIKDIEAFDWLAQKKNLPRHVIPGMYRIKSNISMNDLIIQLRSGMQEEVKLVFNKERTKEDLASTIAGQLELSADSFLRYLNLPQYTEKFNFDTANIISMFIPNTYHVFWTIRTDQLFKRMKLEYDKFWNKRKSTLSNHPLNPNEVIILASIIEEETSKNDEKSRMAGVYLNRLAKGIPLQADPCLKFALRDFGRKRILDQDKKINSRYNTYKYAGLPPGPICTPSIKSIDAVLHFEKHNYYYFCAKDDFSGYHHFSKSLREHNRYARKYHKALNEKRIYK